jgi:hypothetical protein
MPLIISFGSIDVDWMTAIGRIRAREMVNETRAVIGSAAFARLLTSSLDAAFQLLRNDVSDCFKSKSPVTAAATSSSSSSSSTPAPVRVPFVNVSHLWRGRVASALTCVYVPYPQCCRP